MDCRKEFAFLVNQKGACIETGVQSISSLNRRGWMNPLSVHSGHVE